ncbi:Rrp15p-domain-containing protein [Podospora conica]|nr:Rrp15p-domain-containing protein [Schizothecium conicum]
MAGTSLKKRSFSDGPKAKPIRPSKKQKQQQLAAYHSSSSEGESDSEDDNNGAPTANLLDDSDDEDLENMIVDDGASSADDDDAAHSSSDSDADRKRPTKTKKPTKPAAATKPTAKPFVAKDAPASDSSDEEAPSEDDGDSFSDASGDDPLDGAKRPPKRNDSEAMATSMQKILASKMSAARRADPIVARSHEAAAAARAAVDTALETKARRRLREKKRLAMEKGRVRDVLVASTTRTLNVATGEVEETVDDGAETTGQILATERRLRKVAQRGVVKLFNAVRAAQVKAAEAEKVVKKDGVVGVKRKEEKITEMSKKGFLDLIASGGGGLKKGGLEEA